MCSKKVLWGLLVLSLAFFSPAVFAQSPLNETVETTISGIADLFKDNFNSTQALGTPVEAGDYVFIPVVVKGAGFGFGGKLEANDKESRKEQVGNSENKHKDRLGLGAGAFVRPIALIVVKKGGNFELIKLNEGFMTSLAQAMGPALIKMAQGTVKQLFKLQQKKARKNARKNKKKREKEIIIEKKMMQGYPMRPRGMMGPRPPMGPGPRKIQP